MNRGRARTAGPVSTRQRAASAIQWQQSDGGRRARRRTSFNISSAAMVYRRNFATRGASNGAMKNRKPLLLATPGGDGAGRHNWTSERASEGRGTMNRHTPTGLATDWLNTSSTTDCLHDCVDLRASNPRSTARRHDPLCTRRVAASRAGQWIARHFRACNRWRLSLLEHGVQLIKCIMCRAAKWLWPKCV